jgi:acyl-coenzyme A thioesterase PaaI-like protein
MTQSLQDRFAPANRCFGCGPANEKGLRLKSIPSGDESSGGEVLCEWRPEKHHEAFEGMLNGGICGTLLDCHSNWTAAIRLMHDRGLAGPPGCVTADYAIRLRRPTPIDRRLQLRARPVDVAGDRVVVDAEVVVDGIITATCRGTFVAVGPDHPAFQRW